MNSDFKGKLQTEVDYPEYLKRGTPKMGQRKMLGETLEVFSRPAPKLTCSQPQLLSRYQPHE